MAYGLSHLKTFGGFVCQIRSSFLSCREDRDGEGEGHITAAQRFKAAAAALKARDVEDKRDYRERRRTKLGELKAKKWADGKETGPIATLGPGLGYPGEEAPRMSGRLLRSSMLCLQMTTFAQLLA